MRTGTGAGAGGALLRELSSSAQRTPPPPAPDSVLVRRGEPTGDPRPRMWKLRREGGRCHKVSFLVDARGVELEKRPSPGHRRASGSRERSATGPSRKGPPEVPRAAAGPALAPRVSPQSLNSWKRGAWMAQVAEPLTLDFGPSRIKGA